MNTNTFERGREYVLWDGDCGFCRRSAQTLAHMDARSTFVFAPYQSFSESELRKVGLSFRRCARELQVVSKTRKPFGGAFGINYFLWQQPRWKFFVALSFLFPLVWLFEILAYQAVAKNRLLFSRWFFTKPK